MRLDSPEYLLEFHYITKPFDYLFGLEMSCTCPGMGRRKSELCIILFCKHFSKKYGNVDCPALQ